MGQYRFAVIVGTRPEIVKMAPVVHEIDRRWGPGTALVVDTGQHYDAALSGRIRAELSLPAPAVTLDAGGRTRAGCIGYLCAQLGQVLARHPVAAVLVQGDTNTTVAGALAANAEGIPLVHVEAGLRSHDRAMPEEHNRVVTDQLADLCCAATPVGLLNLLREGIATERVVLTGNTVVDAVAAQLPGPVERARVLAGCAVTPERYLLATLHRPENTDDPQRLRAVLTGLAEAAEESGMPVLLPLHPRTRAAAKQANCEGLLAYLRPSEPVGVREFLSLASHAALLVSDSGSVAEEATILKRPLVVFRRSTEHPEAVEAGFARLVTPEAIVPTVRSILAELPAVLARLGDTASPYGDGRSAGRIVSATARMLAFGPVTTGHP